MNINRKTVVECENRADRLRENPLILPSNEEISNVYRLLAELMREKLNERTERKNK